MTSSNRMNDKFGSDPMTPPVSTFDWPEGTAEDGFPIEPFEDCVYIEQVKEETTKSGLIIANTEHSKMPMGRVVAVGPGRFYFSAFNASQTMQAAVFIPTRLKVGDMVLWGRYRTGGEPMEYEGRVYVMAREGDLGGRIKGGKPVNLRLVPQS